VAWGRRRTADALPEAVRSAGVPEGDRLLAAATQPKVVTVNAWNEWPEGSVLEPELEHGYGYLEAIRAVFGTASAKPRSAHRARPR